MTPVKDSEEAWSIPDVYLLTKGSDGTVAIPHLSLTFRSAGVELAKSDGEVVWRCTWTKMDELSTAERSTLPDGRNGIVVVVVERGVRRHRFVLPTEDPAGIEATVRTRAISHRIRTAGSPAPVSFRLTMAVMASAIITLTALLLSAAHVLHF
jgi:hypothetical protein